MWAKASDLYCEEADRDDDDGLAAILHDAWELPTRPVLRNVFRRLPRNTDFDGATFLSKPWLALAVDGHNVVADGRFHDIAFPHDRGACCVGSSRGWLEARLRAGLPLEETDAEMLQRVYKPDKENCPYITMVTLSCSPAGSNDDDCVALCVYRRGRCLAIARPGDALWTRVEVGWEYMVSTANTSARSGGTTSCGSGAGRRDRSFGGRALFLSAGTAFFADARILPWCAGDCIYPIDDESVLAGKNVPMRCYNMRSWKYRWPSGRHGPGTAVLRPESIGPTRPDQHQKHRPRHGLI
ncbi:hypothetical protein OsI_25147 [Oryza sativa Indica Group]|uniref:KIB1-4 beta-propeller domain-containing protein n=1 Tax=Oryza sativa subsp. indica TaxID=39946 RepID=B8B7V7_ORYSI|nr:hypothetical protein OsI_25147 [Oryza sativa Indica Group]